MFIRNVRYEKFPVSVYRKNYTDIIGIPVFLDNYKGKFFNGNAKEILSNSKRENDNFVFEAVSNMFRTTRTQCKISLKWKF
jgi:hypothetical protein